MPHAQSGVTEQTWRNMILDAAVVYVNYGEPNERILGATNGGATFGWQEFNMRSPEIDGLKGPIKGASRITRAVPKIDVNLVEWNLQALAFSFPGVDIVTENGVATIRRSRRLMLDEDYPNNIAMVGTQSGTGEAVVMMLKNPMVMEGTEFPTTQNSEATATVSFVGHYDPQNPEDEPWEIHYPVGDATPAAFTVGQWSVSDDGSGGDITITLSALPDPGDSAITNVQYRLDGGAAVSLSGFALTAYSVSSLTDDQQYGVQVRAVNAEGPGAWSDTKTVTPTGA